MGRQIFELQILLEVVSKYYDQMLFIWTFSVQESVSL